MHEIFVSYRRSVAPAATLEVVKCLKKRYGDKAVFFDTDSIEGADDFSQRILRSLSACKVLVVMIGPDWLNAPDDKGGRRLDDFADFVRSEIRDALGRGTPIIPVLVDEAKLPKKDELPEDIRSLLKFQAREIHNNPDYFDVDFRRLCKSIDKYVKRWRIYVALALISIFIAASISFCYFYRRPGDVQQLVGTWDQHATSGRVRTIHVNPDMTITSDPEFETGPNAIEKFEHVKLTDAVCETEWEFRCDFSDGDIGTFKLKRTSADMFEGTLACRKDPTVYALKFKQVSRVPPPPPPPPPDVDPSHAPPPPTVKAPQEADLTRRVVKGEKKYLTFHYINDTNKKIQIWLFPKKYTHFEDSRSEAWGPGPSINAKSPINDDYVLGGCYNIVIQVHNEPSRRRTVEEIQLSEPRADTSPPEKHPIPTQGGWFDFGWQDGQTITIPENFFEEKEKPRLLLRKPTTP